MSSSTDTNPSSRADDGGFFQRVYGVVRRIPRGRVTTYGAVSRMLTGTSRAARTVGWALAALDPEAAREVPWWRVINAQGRISTSHRRYTVDEQRARLESEGVRFGEDARTDLDRFGWYGPIDGGPKPSTDANPPG